MATVERVSGPSVAPTALPGARVTARLSPNYADKLVQGVRDLGSTVTEIYQREEDTAENMRLLEAKRKLSDWERGWFDPKNPQGVHAKKGRDALGLDDVIAPDFDAVAAELGASFRTDKGRLAFQGMVESQRDSVLGRVETYSTREYEGYQTAEFNANTLNSVELAARARIEKREDDAVREHSLGLSVIRTRAQVEGWPEAQTQQAVRAFNSSVSSTVIASLVETDPLRARDEFARYGPEMLEDDRTRVLRVLQPMVEDAQADQDAAAAVRGEPFGTYVPPERGKPSAAIKKIIEDAAAAHGVPAEYLLAMAEQESSFRTAVKGDLLDDGDRAEGLFQYRKTTADALGGFDRSDPVASANAAARQFKQRMKAHGPEYAMAAHFAGDGGADAVVLRGRTAKNPKTARYVEEVGGRAVRWRGGGKAMGGVDTSAKQATAADALERIAQLPLHRRARAEAKLREQIEIRKMREGEADRAMTESINTAIWEADPNQSLAQVLGKERYAYAWEKGLLGNLQRDLLLRRAGDQTRLDVKPVVGEYLTAYRDNPQAFARMDVMKNARHMSPDTAQQLQKLQQEIRDGKHDTADYATESEQLNALVYVPMKMVGEKSKAKRDAYEAAWFLAKREYTNRTGKPPNAAEREGLIKKLNTMVVLGETGAPAVKDGALRWQTQVAVPADHRKLILESKAAQARRESGKPVDEAWISGMYLRGVR